MTNAVQTMNISATTASGMKRARDRADLALNAQNAKTAKTEAQTSKLESQTALNEAKAKDLASKTERRNQLIEREKKLSIDDLMQDNSEQVQHIKTKIKNDMEWLARRKMTLVPPDESEANFQKALAEWKKKKGGKDDGGKNV